MSRDHAAPAPRWRCISPGVWLREPPPGGVAALVRAQSGRFVMRVEGGPWLDAGDSLLAATEHAGGHAARVELRAARGGDDLCGDCATCERMRKGDGR